MKAQLLVLLAKLQSMASTLQLKAVLVGAAIGYLGHPVIKLAVDAAMLIIKGLLRI
jgi:hypothetical protein